MAVQPRALVLTSPADPPSGTVGARDSVGRSTSRNCA
jgi:hypothetical protein